MAYHTSKYHCVNSVDMGSNTCHYIGTTNTFQKYLNTTKYNYEVFDPKSATVVWKQPVSHTGHCLIYVVYFLNCPIKMSGSQLAVSTPL